MAKKTLEQCRTADDFIRYAQKNGGQIVHSKKGVKVYGTEKGNGGYGYALIHSNHPKELATGTRHALIKALISLGLGVLVISCMAYALMGA